ncbi:MAG: Transposase [Deltaproteobacteria bacterium]|nr:Transposase [Deltaproteobacteria bacterium]
MKTIYKAYRFRLKPNVGQGRQLARIAGVCRLVWNLCLEQRETVYTSRRITLNSYRQLPDVTILRGEYDWIREIPSQVLQQKVRDLDIAYRNFFEGRASFPERKKKGKSIDSFRFPQGFKIDNRRVFLPKIGWVGFFKSRDIQGEPKHMTISRSGKHWFVSICCEVEIANAVPKNKAVGIDRGIAKLCALSDGTVIENPACFGRYKRKLAKLQRRLARKRKFSRNFYKAKAKITALHSRIAHTRRDFIHKTTTGIAKNHGLVVLEDLHVKAMSKSAKGSIDNPGKNVRQKSGLNRSILDAGWSEFRRQLEYKVDWANGIVVYVDPKNTSRRCPICGHTAKENRLTQADFICVSCGYSGDADITAAVNILRAGHARLACGEIGAVRPLGEAGTLKAA